MSLVATFLIGTIVLIVAVVVCITRVNFIAESHSFHATIVDVSYEHVPKGRGSVLAYVPIVEVKNLDETRVIKVSTHDEQPVFQIGTELAVLCDLRSSGTCMRNTFNDLWLWPIALVAIGAGFLFVENVMRLRVKR